MQFNNVIVNAISGCFNLFGRLINALSDQWQLYTAVLLLVLIFRFLILPAFGVSSGFSDDIKNNKSTVKSNIKRS